MFRPLKLILAVVTAVFILQSGCKKNASTQPAPPAPLSALHTDGRWFLNAQNERVLLRGVNIPGMEWDASGDHMLESVNRAIGWGSNLLRIPLAQDRWYGFTSEQTDNGATYRSLVESIVEIGERQHAYIWLDLHWNNGGQWGKYIGQHIMPDRHSLLFWKEVAAIYKNHPAVMFGIYNEPYNIGWDMWRNGGEVDEYYNRNGEDTNLTYNAVGHQEFVNEIRALGADNIIVAGGLDWGFDLSGILTGYALEGENIAYDTHPYPWKDANWDYRFGDVGEEYPLIVGEWGGAEEDSVYFGQITEYIREHKFSWAAWCFHPSAGPQMLQDWTYAPTYFGNVVKEELAKPVDMNEESE
ncbi:cellulase family glycosylhydrolase [candidate division KSB1 bacterium]|nr:cellulase family glycosylhydrolase [candidate division KSB1 bacterium]